MTKRFGFTLAELLIVLGIIGVIAALTMPTLLSNTQGAQYKAAYKKALSVLSQAVVLNVALDDFNFADTTTTGTGTQDQSVYNLLKNRMNVVKTTTTLGYTINTNGNTNATISTTGNYVFFFNDGIAFSFPTTSSACTMDATVSTVKACKGFIDVNGQKAPNKVVACQNGTSGDTCEVTNPTDVYPVIFYDQTILPNSHAARAVLYAK